MAAARMTANAKATPSMPSLGVAIAVPHPSPRSSPASARCGGVATTPGGVGGVIGITGGGGGSALGSGSVAPLVALPSRVVAILAGLVEVFAHQREGRAQSSRPRR